MTEQFALAVLLLSAIQWRRFRSQTWVWTVLEERLLPDGRTQVVWGWVRVR